MPRTALIAAMNEELAALLPAIDDATRQRLGGREFWLGRFAGQPVVAVLCGIGKVAAAVTATLLIGIRPAKSSCDSEMAQGCSCPRHFIADTWTLQESSCRAGGHGGGMRRSSGIRLCGRAGSPACRSQPLHWPMVSTRTWFASG
jgi:hypothetical protein